MGLFDKFRPPPATIPSGLLGQAYVVSASVHHGEALNQTCEMHLVISAPGVTPRAAVFSGPVKRHLWPVPGVVLPIQIDQENPHEFRIVWDQVTPAKDVARAQAESVAALQRGEQVDVRSLLGLDPNAIIAAANTVDDTVNRLDQA